MFVIGAWEPSEPSELSGAFKTSAGVCFLSFSAHRLAQNSARGHFGVTWVAQSSVRVTSGSLRGHFGVTSGSLGSPGTRLGVTSEPLRGHLARENSARGHFEATWLEKTRLGSLRGHLARESSARVLLRPLDSLGLPWLCLARFVFAQFFSAGSAQSSSACLNPRGLTQLGLGRTVRRSYPKKLFENSPSATELCLP